MKALLTIALCLALSAASFAQSNPAANDNAALQNQPRGATINSNANMSNGSSSTTSAYNQSPPAAQGGAAQSNKMMQPKGKKNRHGRHGSKDAGTHMNAAIGTGATNTETATEKPH